MHKKPLGKASIGDLVPYYIKSDLEPWCFNDRTEWGSYESTYKESEDPWGINADDKIPPAYASHQVFLVCLARVAKANVNFYRLLKRSPDDVFNALTEPLRNQLKKDLEDKKPSRKGWDMIMEYDNYSTRSFLRQ
jgi:hypothetical protein